MVEKNAEKSIGNTATSTQNINSNITVAKRNDTAKKYSWMFDGEQVIAELPVRYGMVIGLANEGIIGPAAARAKPQKAKSVKRLIATNVRVAYTDESGQLFNDKKRAKVGRNGRQFFFYDKNAFEDYLYNAIKHNSEIIENYKKSNKSFAKFYDKNHIPGKFSKKLFKEGYITSVYVLNNVAPATEKTFKNSNVNKSAGMKAAKYVVGAHRDTSFLDRFRKGFALNGTELYLPGMELNLNLTEEGKAPIAKLTNLTGKLGGDKASTRVAEFYVRPRKESSKDLEVLVNDLIAKADGMKAYADGNFAMGEYQKYMRNQP